MSTLHHLPCKTHIEYVLPPLDPQNATNPPTAPTEIAESTPSDVHLQTNALSPPQSPQHISPSQFSGDHIHHNIKYLEQLLDSSLATAAVIQFSGNTLADVLTPRAYDAFKTVHALAHLDSPALSIKTTSRRSDIPTRRSTVSEIGDDCPSSYSRNRSEFPPMSNSNLAADSQARTVRIHVSIVISVDHSGLFSCVGLAALYCFVLVF